MKILILEDDPARITMMASFIGESSNSLTFVSKINDAVDQLLSGDFDMMLLDHDVEDFSGTYGGEVTGSSLTRWISQTSVSSSFKGIQFIVHSKNAMKADAMADQLRSKGFMVSLAPYGSEEFRHVLQGIKYSSVDFRPNA